MVPIEQSLSYELIPWIGIDLDGTLAQYDHWRGTEHIGKPIIPMVQLVRCLLNEGTKVKIFTARVCEGEESIKIVKKWCIKVFGEELEVTNVKDFAMIELWDDRCRQVILNQGKFIITKED